MAGYIEKTCAAAHLRFLCVGSPGGEATLGQGEDRSDGTDRVMGRSRDSECGREAIPQAPSGETRVKADLEGVGLQNLTCAETQTTMRVTQREGVCSSFWANL